MALIKEIIAGSGTVLTYHAIRFVKEDKGGLTGSVRVQSYPNADARWQGAKSKFWTDVPVVWTSNFNRIAEAYEFLKTTPRFSGAIDV